MIIFRSLLHESSEVKAILSEIGMAQPTEQLWDPFFGPPVKLSEAGQLWKTHRDPRSPIAKPPNAAWAEQQQPLYQNFVHGLDSKKARDVELEIL